MHKDHFVNLAEMDWTVSNRQVIKFCKEQADKAALAHTNKSDNPLLDTPHFPVVVGVLRWAILDRILENAVENGLFEGITGHWIEHQGAPIFELRGKYTSLTAKHVLSRHETLTDSKNGYRNNNRAKNQKNQELFKELEAPSSSDELLHIVLQHGGQNDNFAFFRVYLEASDVPDLFGNLMLMPALDMAPDTELVLKPTVTLKDVPAIAKPDNVIELVKTNENDDSKS